MKTLIAVIVLAVSAAPVLAQTSPSQTVPSAGPAATARPVSTPAPRPAGAAAATLPNTFDNPAAAPTAMRTQASPAPSAVPPAATAAEIGPDVKRAEDALRAVVAGVQGDSLNYAMFSDDLATRIRGQAATIGPLIKGFGELQDVIYVGQEQGAELFALDFANARTQWIIGFNAEDQIALLLFRPAPAVEAADPAPAPAAAPRVQ